MLVLESSQPNQLTYWSWIRLGLGMVTFQNGHLSRSFKQALNSSRHTKLKSGRYSGSTAPTLTPTTGVPALACCIPSCYNKCNADVSVCQHTHPTRLDSDSEITAELGLGAGSTQAGPVPRHLWLDLHCKSVRAVFPGPRLRAIFTARASHHIPPHPAPARTLLEIRH
jgi:hypothetical protein